MLGWKEKLISYNKTLLSYQVSQARDIKKLICELFSGRCHPNHLTTCGKKKKKICQPADFCNNFCLLLSFRAVPVCLSETQRLPLQCYVVCERHHGGQNQLLLRVPLRSWISAGQEELLQADLAGWWDTLSQVRFHPVGDGQSIRGRK